MERERGKERKREGKRGERGGGKHRERFSSHFNSRHIKSSLPLQEPVLSLQFMENPSKTRASHRQPHRT